MSSNLQPTVPAKLADLITDTWFTFEGDIQIKAWDAPVIPEPDRTGAGGVNCKACDRSDDAFVWSNDKWRLHGYSPSQILGTVLLQTREHYDSFQDMPAELLADLGSMTKRIEQAQYAALGNVGRVHVIKWGDGGEHFHLWFIPRPLGALQLRGSMLPVWMDVMSDLPDEDVQAAFVRIAAALDS